MRLLKAIIAGCLFAAAACSFADGYPSRPIRFIVPFSAGGLGDVTARPLAKELGQQLGQPVVVENKPGANTTLGLGLVAHAPADGYTLVLGTEAGLSNAPNIWPHLPYDPIRDFIPIAIVTSASQVLVVNAKSPIRNLHDLVAEARRRPGGIPYGSLGLGSTAHIAMEELGMLSSMQS